MAIAVTGIPASAQTLPLTLQKSFAPASVALNGTTQLTFTLNNPNAATALTGISFSDTMPAGMTIVSPLPGPYAFCSGTATIAPGSMVMSGMQLAAGGSCSFTMSVQGTLLGSLTNTTSSVASDQTTPVAPATATLTVTASPGVTDGSFQVRYAANLQYGESYVNITNTGANGALLTGPGFGGATGNICVNMYAFDPNEEMISCCSCLVTPDQVRTLGINRDITSNTTIPLIPTSMTVKLLATLAGTNGTGTSCTNSAALIGSATLVGGYTAYGTTLHPTPAVNTFTTTETPFTPSTLSTGELNHLANTCGFIVGNLSGFGVCASCRNGALGSQRM